MKKNKALALSGIIFLVMAIGHVLRVFYGLDIVISGYIVPMWFSYVGIVVGVMLSLVMLIACRR